MMNVEELRKDTKKAAPLFKKSPLRTMPAYSNAGVMQPQCVLSLSLPSECEEV